MTGRSRAGPRRGASINRPAAVIFHARVEPAATSTRPWRAQAARAPASRGPGAPTRRRAHPRDLTGADGLAVVLVLGVAEGAEDDALFGGHDPPNLPTALTGWLDERPVLLLVDQ